MKRQCPWNDYAGNELFEGDRIAHPSGEVGEILFLSAWADPQDQWRVQYGPIYDLSRLCLQIGDKGQAVKVLARYDIDPRAKAEILYDGRSIGYMVSSAWFDEADTLLATDFPVRQDLVFTGDASGLVNDPLATGTSNQEIVVIGGLFKPYSKVLAFNEGMTPGECGGIHRQIYHMPFEPAVECSHFDNITKGKGKKGSRKMIGKLGGGWS